MKHTYRSLREQFVTITLVMISLQIYSVPLLWLRFIVFFSRKSHTYYPAIRKYNSDILDIFVTWNLAFLNSIACFSALFPDHGPVVMEVALSIKTILRGSYDIRLSVRVFHPGTVCTSNKSLCFKHPKTWSRRCPVFSRKSSRPLKSQPWFVII